MQLDRYIARKIDIHKRYFALLLRQLICLGIIYQTMSFPLLCDGLKFLPILKSINTQTKEVERKAHYLNFPFKPAPQKAKNVARIFRTYFRNRSKHDTGELTTNMNTSLLF